MAKKNVKLGIFFILLLALAMSVSASISIDESLENNSFHTSGTLDLQLDIDASGDSFSFVNSQSLNGNNINSIWLRGEDNYVDSLSNLTFTQKIATVYSPGKFGQAFNFSGTNYIKISNRYANYLNDVGLTASVWFKTNQTSKGVIFDNGGGFVNNGNSGMAILINTGKLTFQGIDLYAGNLNFGYTTTELYNDSQWHHAILTWDGSTETDGVRIYIDGVNVENLTANKGIDTFNQYNYMTLGTLAVTPLWYFNGLIDEAIYLPRGISHTEALNLYNTTTGSYDISIEGLNDAAYYQDYSVKAFLVNTSNNLETSDKLTISSDLIVFPLLEATVVQRDILTNVANLTVEFKVPSEITEVNISLGATTVEVAVTNPDSQVYVFEDMAPGCYELIVESGTYSSTVESYCIGDVIITHGQSNSLQAGMYTYDTEFPAPDLFLSFNYSQIGYERNPDALLSIMGGNNQDGFLRNIPYSFNYSDISTWRSAIFYPLAQSIAVSEDVPVMILELGLGGVGIEGIINDAADTQTQNEMVFKYSDGVSFLIWVQGEANYMSSVSSYTANLESLMTTWDSSYDFQYDTKFLIVPPVTGNGASDEPCSYVDLFSNPHVAQYNLANSRNDTEIIASLIDLRTDIIHGCIHIANVSRDGYYYSKRVNESVMDLIYNDGNKLRSDIVNTYLYNSTSLLVEFDNPIKITNYAGTAGNLAYGFSLYSTEGSVSATANYSNADLLSSEIINDKFLLQTFDTDISDSIDYSYCAYPKDCWNLSLVRHNDSVYNDISLLVYREDLLDITDEIICTDLDNEFWFNNACYPDLQTACDSNNLVVSGNTCISKQEDTCNSISEQIYDSFSLGVIALIILVASLIVGILMTAFGGAGFDSKMITGTIAMVIMTSIMFVIGIIVYGYVTGAIC